MPLWSIGEWRARIGSSWCALGRPFKTRSPFRGGGGGGRVLRALTRSDVVTMIIMLMVLIGINFGLRILVMRGYHRSLESELLEANRNTLTDLIIWNSSIIGYFEFDASSLLQKLYLINCCLLLTFVIPIIKIAAPLVYHSLPSGCQNGLSQFCSGLLWYSLLAGCFITRWLVLPLLRTITPPVADAITSWAGYYHAVMEYLHYATNFINHLILLGM